MEILFLRQDEVAGILTVANIIECVENAFREKGLGEVQMPPKVYIYYKKFNGDLRIMPSYMERSEKSGVKVVNVHPNNPTSKGLPTIMAVIILIDPCSGTPLALMDGTLITAARTGASGGVATKWLARKDSKVLGLVGAGRQAITQLESIAEVRSLTDVKVYDRFKEISKRFVTSVKNRFDFRIEVADSIEACVKNSDIVTTITPSRKPIIENDWIGAGTHINAIGADAAGKQELDPKILKRAKIVVDDWEQACHSGEVNVPLSKGILSKKDVYSELSEIICGKRNGRESSKEITIFDSTGLSIQDVTTAWMVYKEAKNKGIGTWLTLFK